MRCVILLVSLILTNALAFQTAKAEQKSFVREYTYEAGEADSKLTSRAIALEQVKRLLLEELGTYLESYTEVKNFQLTKDQIVVLSAGVVQTTIIDEKWDGREFWLKAKIEADPVKVVEGIDKLRNDHQKAQELEEASNRADEALKVIATLKQELAKAKSDEAKQENQKNYVQQTNILTSVDWNSIGTYNYEARNYQEAINAYTKAIGLSPNYAWAYNNRGGASFFLGHYQQAVNDFNKALELDPRRFEFYDNRGGAYGRLGEYQKALKDHNMAIQLNPNDASPYNNRGGIYFLLGEYKKAISDYNMAIKLNPRFADPYSNRGLAQEKLNDYQKAIGDYGRAIELNPLFVDAYIYRGSAYDKIGNHQQAKIDLDRAIEIDPSNPKAYFFRAGYYIQLRNMAMSIKDLKIAARLGDKDAQSMLLDLGENW